MRYKAALRDESKLAKDLAAARGGLLPHAERVMQARRTVFRYPPALSFGGGLHVRKDLLAEKGPQDAEGLRSRRRRDGEEDAGSFEGHLGIRPDAQPVRRRERLHAEHPLGLRRGAPGTRRASPL